MLGYLITLLILTVIALVSRTQHAAIHENKMQGNNPLTSHILDTARGVPAAGVRTVLYKLGPDQAWTKLMERETNEDGRLSNVLTAAQFEVGVYKFFFDTKAYYGKLGTKTFYPYVEIVFEIERPEEHYHVPLLLSPYGFSTYRGS